MTRYVAGSIVINSVEHFTGEVSQAAKNLYIWKLYSLPLTLEEANTVTPTFIKKGRAKSYALAEAQLIKEYNLIVKPMLEAIKLNGILSGSTYVEPNNI